MLERLKIFLHNGKQYIPDPTAVEVPGRFRGRPVIAKGGEKDNAVLVELCPTGAITNEGGLALDLGRCCFCGECERRCPNKIRFTKDYKMATNVRERLVVREGEESPITLDSTAVRDELKGMFRHSLKLRQVSAAGDNSCEWELGATSNVNFDMGRYGIEFVASPRHADGIVITGPISKNMAKALEICDEAVPDPKIVVLAGTDAISGGIFSDSEELDRTWLESHKPDLYLPGNPCHPLTVINGLLELMKSK
ncbi:MAG: NADH:ubiquinone oxidoreductase [Bacteroidales bacterium]|nr:NADH:ubiquinone oxidoreductase [Bacteroidales bacterium]